MDQHVRKKLYLIFQDELHEIVQRLTHCLLKAERCSVSSTDFKRHLQDCVQLTYRLGGTAQLIALDDVARLAEALNLLFVSQLSLKKNILVVYGEIIINAFQAMEDVFLYRTTKNSMPVDIESMLKKIRSIADDASVQTAPWSAHSVPSHYRAIEEEEDRPLTIIRRDLERLSEQLMLSIAIDSMPQVYDTIDDLQTHLQHMELVAVSTLVLPMVRKIKQMALNEGVFFSATVTGGELRVDRSLLYRLKQPLFSLFQEIIGYQSEHRTKDELHQGLDVAVSVVERDIGWQMIITDNGRGIDYDGLIDQYSALGVASKPTLLRWPKERVADLLFFSHRHLKTQQSEWGSRHGLDRVRDHLQRMHGSISVADAQGGGRCFTLFLPQGGVMRSTIEIALGGCRYLLLHDVVRSIHTYVADAQVYVDRIPYYTMGQERYEILQADKKLSRSPGWTPSTAYALIVNDNSVDKVLLVDAVFSEHTVFIKPFAPPAACFPYAIGLARLSPLQHRLVLNIHSL